MRFSWDPRKAASNVRKHRVTFEEAMSAFADPLGIVRDDALDSNRTVLIGLSARMRLLVTIYVEIADDEARIISARLATNHERRDYEEGI